MLVKHVEILAICIRVECFCSSGNVYYVCFIAGPSNIDWHILANYCTQLLHKEIRQLLQVKFKYKV